MLDNRLVSCQDSVTRAGPNSELTCCFSERVGAAVCSHGVHINRHAGTPHLSSGGSKRLSNSITPLLIVGGLEEAEKLCLCRFQRTPRLFEASDSKAQ